MKCLLIDIGYDCEELNEPLGIEVLLSYLKEKSNDIEIFCHFSNVDGDNYKELFESCNPDIIALSTHINTWHRMDKVYFDYIQYSINNEKKPIVVVGGILGTYEYEAVLNKYSNTICSIGEGEESLLQILNIAKSLEVLDFDLLTLRLKEMACNNLAYCWNGIIHVSDRSVIQDLSSNDFTISHRYLKSILSKGGIVRVEASRGCPWNKCSFCVLKWKYGGSTWRPYSWKKVIPEIIEASSQGATSIYFTDEEFLAGDYERIQDFVNQIKYLKQIGAIYNNLEFVASTSAQALLGKYGMSKEEVEASLVDLKEIGFRSFFLGIESGADSQLKRFRKGSTVKDNENALTLLRKYSIEVDVGYILFDPLMTVKELSESLEFLKRNGLNSHISRFAKRLRLVPHTVYYDLKDIRKKQYDVNAVEEKYEFKDARIQKIYDCYSQWEVNHLRVTHTIQAKIRATESSTERSCTIKKLEKIRENEYIVLSKLVSLSASIPDFEEKSIEEIVRYI